MNQKQENTSTSVAQRVHTSRIESEPLQNGVQNIIERVIETGHLPGAPAAHKRFADYIEYAQAIVSSTTTVAEAITPQDLKYFALGLPLFHGERPRESELDTRDIQNLISLNRCLPTMDVDVAHYHVSATYHTGKLLLIAALNPRAIEWIFMAAILVQRGMHVKITDLLLDRKDRFLEIMHQDLASQDGNFGIDRAIIAFSATLERVIVNVVTSLKSLNLGELGGEVGIDDILPDRLDFDHYVTSDATIFSVAREAELLGCQFHDEILFIEAGTADHDASRKRAKSERHVLSRNADMGRLRRIEILQTIPGTSRYHILNSGPTGRVPHGRLVSGLFHALLSRSIPPGQREKLRTALSQPASINFTLEVDLATGIGDILVDDPNSKAFLECPGLSIEEDLPEPASIRRVDDVLQQSQLKDIEFLDFSTIAVANSANWDQIVHTFLVIKGWWWSKHLVRDLPTELYVPHHSSYFHAMARIGLTMLHLEQKSGCVISTNALFDVLRFLTNLGGVHDAMTHEAATYAAQGPGGTLVHDILGEVQPEWSQNPFLAYRWLLGKFPGIPEVALFAHGCEFRKFIPIPEIDIADAMARSDPLKSSVTIFADSTDGHTLSCAIVSRERKIRSLPFIRVLCGLLLAYIGQNSSCNHSQDDGTAFVDRENAGILPWAVIEDHYFGRAEMGEEDTFIITGIENSKLFQVMALGVSKENTAIDTKGCVVCAFECSNHVIKTRWQEK